MHTKANTQRAILRFLQIALPGDALIHATLAEGNRGGRKGVVDGARRKAMGQLAGMPDLMIAVRGRVAFMEVKTPSGRVSPAQKSVHENLSAQGLPVAVVRSVDDADRFIAEQGLLRSQLGNRKGGGL